MSGLQLNEPTRADLLRARPPLAVREILALMSSERE
jgi:hypothetical protein